jgi:hypothetical protein
VPSLGLVQSLVEEGIVVFRSHFSLSGRHYAQGALMKEFLYLGDPILFRGSWIRPQSMYFLRSHCFPKHVPKVLGHTSGVLPWDGAWLWHYLLPSAPHFPKGTQLVSESSYSTLARFTRCPAMGMFSLPLDDKTSGAKSQVVFLNHMPLTPSRQWIQWLHIFRHAESLKYFLLRMNR